MCGFLGIYGKIRADDYNRYRAAAQRLRHRGNSDYREKITDNAALFHHRLAFRDLADGKQPLTDTQGQATIIFNGELYDFLPLRGQLENAGYQFQTRSDTEVILAAHLIYKDTLLTKLDGEYAFVINEEKQVTAARDVFGVKPIFLSNENLAKLPDDFFRTYKESYNFTLKGQLHFASEIKGLPIQLQWDQHGLERQVLGLYEEMQTPFTGVVSLPPGALFSAQWIHDEWQCTITRHVEKRRSSKLVKSDFNFEVAAKELKTILSKNVRDKLDAEVPLGAYLSGGVDSRIAAYEMGKAGASIETFTVGFEGKDFDESQDVLHFTKKFPNLKARILRTTDESLAYAYPHAIYASELVQPYTNGAAKWWLSRFSRRHVRGVLTGDGADELFCGYPSYRYLAWWQFYQRYPSDLRKSLYAAKVEGKSKKYWEQGLSSLSDGSDLKQSLRSLGWEHPLFSQIQAMAKGFQHSEVFKKEKEALLSYVSTDQYESPLTRWQNYFLHTHFPTHVLNWVGDRMEMANTLEGRPIFLSKSTLNFMRSLPDHALVKGMRDKAILRAAYRDELGNFASGKKKQFNAPFLYNSAPLQHFLQEENVKKAGVIPYEIIKKAKAGLKIQTPLERSFTQMLLQNLLVVHMLHEYLVVGNAPERDTSYEEQFLDERTNFL